MNKRLLGLLFAILCFVSVAQATDFTTGPTNVAAASVADTTASLSWTAPNPAGEKYDVMLNGVAVQSDLTTTTASLTALTPCTTYNVVVVAKKTGYTSINSASYNFKTEAGAQAAITSVALSPISFLEMFVSITDVVRFNCAKLEYRVELYDSVANKTFTASGPGLTYSFGNLEPSKQYVASVIVRDLIKGTDSSKVSSQPASTPAIPSQSMPTLSSPTGLKVSDITQNGFIASWTSSPEDITGYYVYYGNGNSMKVLAPTTRAEMTSLLPCTKYDVSIASFKDTNQSPKSEIITIFTLPEKPPSLKAVAIADGPDGSQAVVTITDDSVKQDCSPWTYIIKAYSNNVVLSSDSTKSNPFTVSGLTPGTAYTFGVSLRLTDFGLVGPELQSTAYTTIAKKPVFPNGPLNLSVTKRTNVLLTLSWTPLANAVSYTIKSNGVDGSANPSTGQATETATLSNLEPCKEYFISVFAASSDGSKSPISKELKTSTAAVPPTAVTSVTVTPIDSSQVILNIVDSNTKQPCSDYWYIVTVGKTVIRTFNKKITIIDLVPNTSYTGTIVVVDVNSNAMSTAFNIPSFTVPRTELPKPSTPVAFEVKTDEMNAILKWTSGPDVVNVKVVSYLITYRNSAGDVNSISVMPFLPTQAPPTTFTVTKLTPCTEYTFSVKAVSDKDKLSDSSSVVVAKTSTPFPQPPSTLVIYESTLIKYRIKESLTKNECNKVQYSIVLYEAGMRTVKVDQIKSDSLEGEFPAKNITPGKKYHAIVKVQDTITELYSRGVTSDPIVLKGSNPLPAKVTNIRLTTKDEKSISLQWDSASLAKTYLITFSASGTMPLMKEANSTDVVLTNLFACTKYQIYVQAKSDFGLGDYSDLLEVDTNSKLIYEPIRSIKLKGISDTEIEYKIFDVPRYCGTFKYSFIITGGNKNIAPFDTDQSSGKISSLSPSTEYTVSIVVKDDKVAENVSAAVKGIGKTLPTGASPSVEKTAKASLVVSTKDHNGNEIEFNRDFLNPNSDAFSKLEGKTCESMILFASYSDNEINDCSISSVKEGSTLASVDLAFVVNNGQVMTSQMVADTLTKGAALAPPTVLKDAGISLSVADLAQVVMTESNAANTLMSTSLVGVLVIMLNLI